MYKTEEIQANVQDIRSKTKEMEGHSGIPPLRQPCEEGVIPSPPLVVSDNSDSDKLNEEVGRSYPNHTTTIQEFATSPNLKTAITTLNENNEHEECFVPMEEFDFGPSPERGRLIDPSRPFINNNPRK